MKRILAVIFIILLCWSILIPIVYADGMYMVKLPDSDEWELFDEKAQNCAINYKDGIQNMILEVSIEEGLEAGRAVWLFPVPAVPEKTAIDIIKGFPAPSGDDVIKTAKDKINDYFRMMLVSQIYPIPFLPSEFFSRNINVGMHKGIALGNTLEYEGVIIHESTTKMGLTTQLVSAVDKESFSKYLSDKGLIFPDKSNSILQEYIGQQYSFVVSWIDNAQIFLQEQKKVSSYNKATPQNSIGVFVTFPTDKMYFPLRPTSVYDSKIVPVNIIVMDYVKPQLFPEIKAYTDIKYYFNDWYSLENSLKTFFFGQEGYVKNFKYTKISMDAASKFLVKDLWIKNTAPFGVEVADFINKQNIVHYLLVLAIISVLSSLIAGAIIFRHSEVSRLRLILTGLLNVFTIISVIIATLFFRTKKAAQEVKNYISDKGNEIFEESHNKYYKALGYWGALFIAQLTLLLLYILDVFPYSYSENIFIAIVFAFLPYLICILAFLSLLVLLIYMCYEKLKPEYNEDMPNNFKIFNMNKLILLFVLNFAFTTPVVGLNLIVIPDILRHYYVYDTFISAIVFALTVNIVFVLSTLSLIFIEKKFGKICVIDNLEIYNKIRGNFSFVLLFSVLFIGFAFASKMILSGLISIQ